jgi:RimJ/RimL family protein N-acetyltransferase
MNEGNIPVLRAEKLILRPFSIDDGPEVQRMAGDDEIARNTLAMPHPYLDGMAENWISTHLADFRDGKSAIWAITLADTGQLAGAIGLMLQTHLSNAEAGYWIGKQFWNKGYCTEALRTVIDFGLNDLKLHKIYASHFGDNPQSGRVMQKAGMVYEATLKSHMFHWNKHKDLVFYGIWRTRQPE